jgi:hypothetical protein
VQLRFNNGSGVNYTRTAGRSIALLIL